MVDLENHAIFAEMDVDCVVGGVGLCVCAIWAFAKLTFQQFVFKYFYFRSNMNAQPNGIAPHEGKELELMLTGKKQVAKFSDFIPADFVPYLVRGQFHYLVSFHVTDGEFAFPTFVIYAPQHQQKAQQLLQLLKPELLVLDETHRQIGRILGYEEWQIDAFLHCST